MNESTTDAATGWLGLDGFDADLAKQRVVLAKRVPAYERIVAITEKLLATDPRVKEQFTEVWGARRFFAAYERPLLFLAGLRFDALRAAGGHPLHAAIAAPQSRPETVNEEALSAALAPGRELWRSLTTRLVQTNETSRAVAWLWPASCIDGPIALVDLGASAGLNLTAEGLDNIWFTDEGPCPVAQRPHVVARVGLDANPLDVTEPDMADWLRACVWPGETTRLRRLEAAVRVWCSRDVRQHVLPMQAEDMADQVLRTSSALADDVITLAYQTFFRDYLSSKARKTYELGMERAIRSLKPGQLVWLEMENAGDGHAELPVSLTAHCMDETNTLHALPLARCFFHPTKLQVNTAAWRQFTQIIAARTAPAGRI